MEIMTRKVRVLENCKNWLVEKGRVYEVDWEEKWGVVLKHPLRGVKPSLLKGEYEEVENDVS